MKLYQFLFFLLCCCLSDANAQSFEIESGPIQGHNYDTYLIKISKKLEEDKFQARLEEATVWKDKPSVETFKKVHKKYYVVRTAKMNVDTVELDTFQFVLGSCSFAKLWNTAKRERIFKSATDKQGKFMIWMGDNVYYLFGRSKNYKKMAKANIWKLQAKRVNQLLEMGANYAIWDDHDFGPNNADGRFKNKDISLQVFKDFWDNPSYGTNGEDGVFTKFSYGNSDFFLLDSRFNCYPDKQEMLGRAQLDWLKEGLKNSQATFKFIISGLQMLPENSIGEELADYPKEKKELLEFLDEEEIEGIIFCSGDRHYAEYNKLEREDNYTFYEFTTSPMTSWKNPAWTRNNPTRVDSTLVLEQNFGRIRVLGENACVLELYDADGKLLWDQRIEAQDLKKKKEEEETD